MPRVSSGQGSGSWNPTQSEDETFFVSPVQRLPQPLLETVSRLASIHSDLRVGRSVEFEDHLDVLLPTGHPFRHPARIVLVLGPQIVLADFHEGLPPLALQ